MINRYNKSSKNFENKTSTYIQKNNKRRGVMCFESTKKPSGYLK